jgi:hypothetical protein
MNQVYHNPASFKELAGEWLKGQSKTVGKFFAYYVNLSEEQRRELFEDMENLVEWGQCVNQSTK